MDDDAKISRISQLDGYVSRLRGLLGSVEGLDFSQFKQAGTTNWSGEKKSSKFDEQHQEGTSQLKKTAPEIEEAISTCKNKMYSLAWSIDDPFKKAQALGMIWF
ncbi:hypothetical protein [Lactovum odontotermitis]